MDREKKIYVFADFLSFKNELIGTIYYGPGWLIVDCKISVET